MCRPVLEEFGDHLEAGWKPGLGVSLHGAHGCAMYVFLVLTRRHGGMTNKCFPSTHCADSVENSNEIATAAEYFCKGIAIAIHHWVGSSWDNGDMPAKLFQVIILQGFLEFSNQLRW